MDEIDEIIERDRAALAQADCDQAHAKEILAEEERKFPPKPMVSWFGYLLYASMFVLAMLILWS